MVAITFANIAADLIREGGITGRMIAVQDGKYTHVPIPEPGNPQTLNRYSYANNNPVNFTDPSGHLSFKKFLRIFIPIVVGIVVGLVTFGVGTAAGLAATSAGILGGAVGGAAAGAVGTALNGGNLALNIVLGAAFGAIGAGVGGPLSTSLELVNK